MIFAPEHDIESWASNLTMGGAIGWANYVFSTVKRDSYDYECGLLESFPADSH